MHRHYSTPVIPFIVNLGGGGQYQFRGGQNPQKISRFARIHNSFKGYDFFLPPPLTKFLATPLQHGTDPAGASHPDSLKASQTNQIKYIPQTIQYKIAIENISIFI